ncbi:CinA family protein [Acinetobacter haemolyticus]|uniref:CinA family protein n=2 Tax=Acinetobacter haemolyticus TaxID=29430 RepID=UPI000D69EC3F|nr:CinA family protein [Acinetobacter haemolyticus]
MLKKTCKKLSDLKLKIFFIESASAGYLAYQFSLDPHSGDILNGGLVCYDLKIKENLLNVSHKLVEKHTAESMQVTAELIKKARKICKSDIYVSCTGLLKKGGSETKKKPVGTFFYCIKYKNKIYKFKTIYDGSPQSKLKKLLNDICSDIYKILQN